MSQKRAIRRVTIRGHVQGVGFRAWTEHEATRRALEGWARNGREGGGGGLSAGPPEPVADRIQACRRGPPMSRVDALDTQDAHLNDFGQRRAGETFSLLPTEGAMRLSVIIAVALSLSVAADHSKTPVRAPPPAAQSEASIHGYGDRDKT